MAIIRLTAILTVTGLKIAKETFVGIPGSHVNDFLTQGWQTNEKKHGDITMVGSCTDGTSFNYDEGALRTCLCKTCKVAMFQGQHACLSNSQKMSVEARLRKEWQVSPVRLEAQERHSQGVQEQKNCKGQWMQDLMTCKWTQLRKE